MGKNVPAIEIIGNKIKLPKLGLVKFKGLSKNFKGEIRSISVEKRRDGKYFASILVETQPTVRLRSDNQVIGVDLGLKEFAVCSNGEIIKGIKKELLEIEENIKKQQRHFSRKVEQNKKDNIKDSKRREKCRRKLAALYQYRTDYLNHYQWHLANRMCEKSQLIILEDLNVAGMKKNRCLSHSIHNANWSSFVTKLEQKANEYGTKVEKIDRFFPSSKMCSECGAIKKDLKLSDRTYVCECGLVIDRDLNAAINIRNAGLTALSLEYSDYIRGEDVCPHDILYDGNGHFSEKRKQII